MEKGNPDWNTAIPATCPIVYQPFCRVVVTYEFGNIVNAAEYETMLAVKIRRSAVQSPIQLIARRIDELINRAARVIVSRASDGISGEELKSVAEKVLRQRHLQRTVARYRSCLDLLHTAGQILVR